MTRLLTLLLALAATAPVARACPDGVVTRVSLQSSVETARYAFAQEDWAIFEYAVQQTTTLLECIDEPLVSEDIAAVFLVRGLLAWRQQGPTAAAPPLQRYAQLVGEAPVESMEAQALRFPLPNGLTAQEIAVFSDERLQDALLATELDCGRKVPPPLLGKVVIDGGGEGSCRREEGPWVFQRVRGDQVAQTRYLVAGQGLPLYPKLRPVLTEVGVGAGVVGVGLLIGAAGIDRSMREFPPEGWQPDVEVEALWFDRRERLNHGLFISGAALSGVSLVSLGALGVTFVF